MEKKMVDKEEKVREEDSGKRGEGVSSGGAETWWRRQRW